MAIDRPRVWSPMATQDLLDIWKHVHDAASAAIADAQLREIDHTCLLLGHSPELGKARDDVRAGVRSIRVDRYIVFYRTTRDAIEIVRVLDERRDVDALFGKELRSPDAP